MLINICQNQNSSLRWAAWIVETGLFVCLSKPDYVKHHPDLCHHLEAFLPGGVWSHYYSWNPRWGVRGVDWWKTTLFTLQTSRLCCKTNPHGTDRMWRRDTFRPLVNLSVLLVICLYHRETWLWVREEERVVFRGQLGELFWSWWRRCGSLLKMTVMWPRFNQIFLTSFIAMN